MMMASPMFGPGGGLLPCAEVPTVFQSRTAFWRGSAPRPASNLQTKNKLKTPPTSNKTKLPPRAQGDASMALEPLRGRMRVPSLNFLTGPGPVVFLEVLPSLGPDVLELMFCFVLCAASSPPLAPHRP